MGYLTEINDNIMKFMRSIRIKARLLLIVFISMFVISCMVAAFYITSTQLVLKKTKEYVYSTAYNVKHNFDTYLANCIEQLNIMATDVSFIKSVNGFNQAVKSGDWSSYSTIQNELYSTARKIPGLVGIEVSGLSSSIVFNTRSLTAGYVWTSAILDTMINSKDRIHTFGRIELESRPSISNKGRFAVIIGMQIKSHIDGRVIGAIILAVSDDYLSTALYPPEDITGSDLLVYDPQGKVICTTSEKLAAAPELNSINSEETFFGLLNLNNSEHLVSQLNTTPLKWRVLLLNDYRSFTAPLIREYHGATVISVVLLFVLLISVLLVTNSVNTPINQLIKAMRNTSRQNRFPLVNVAGSDELAYLGTTFNDMSQRIQQLILEINDVNDKKRAAELLALQSQINPHLLYNSLDSINWIAYTAGNQDICGIIAALSDFYRLTLDKGHTFHPVRNELKQIESYLKLQSMNYHHKIVYSINAQDECLDCLVPKIILQPIIENSLTHGFSEAELSIMINVYKHLDNLVIEVSDNGPGIENYNSSSSFPEPSYGENCHGYGLYNINERIKLFFGEQYGISLHHNYPKGLIVRFTLSIQQNIDKRGTNHASNDSRQ